MHRPKHLIRVQAGARIDFVQKLVGITPLVDGQVSVFRDIVEHLLTRSVIAFTVAVKRQIDRKCVKLFLGFVGKLRVGTAFQIVVVLGATRNVRALRLVRLEYGLLVFGVMRSGQLEDAPDSPLLAQGASRVLNRSVGRSQVLAAVLIRRLVRKV
jgi:hypothetical protein